MRDGWVETTLSEVTECSWGNTETTKSKYVESGYLAYSASGADGFLDWFEHDRTAVVLSAIGAQCGKTWFAEGRWTSIKNTIWLKSDNSNLLDKYLFYLSNRNQFWQIRGQAQPFISLGDVKKTKVLLPPLPVQKRIIDLISSVDSYIAAHERQLESGNKSRNAVLHELSTKSGDGWVKTTLDEVSSSSWGNTETTKSKYAESGYLAYSASGADGFLDWYDHDGSGVVLSAIGAQCGKAWLAEGKWTSIKNTIWLKSDNKNLIDEYLYYLANRSQFWQIRGQAQPFISLGDVKKTNVFLPPLKEQRRIVELISSMDEMGNRIKLILSKAKTLRSGLLSNLLSGEHIMPESYDKLLDRAS